MSRNAAGRLHVITDESIQSRFSHFELACFAVRGGADAVQFREKRDWPLARRVSVARAIRERAGDSDVRLIVNDHPEVAAAAGAAGVHLGPRDLSPRRARGLLGADAIVGVTANDLDRARELCGEPIDYLGLGPVFGTSSKADPAPALGLDGLRCIAAAVDVPVIAIGGITPQRVADVLAAGAHGIAVLSAVAAAPDPAERVAEFAAAIEQALGARAR